MKKLVLVAALALGSLSAFAQDAETEVQSEATEVQSEATEVQSEATEVQSEATEVQSEATEVQSEATEATEAPEVMEAEATEAQDSFTAIEVSEIPAAITDALTKDHPDATINSASVNAETQYKLEVTKEDGSELTLYADAEGNWLEM